MNEIGKLQSRIFNKEKEYDPIEVYHFFMLYYGYIPFRDFNDMDAGIKERLVELLNEYIKKSNGGKKW